MNNWRPVIALVKKSKNFLVTCHHNPDADALGSSLSIALWLKSLGKKVVVVNEDPVAKWLTFLPATATVKVADTVKNFNYDCAIVCDCGDIERVGKVKRLLVDNAPMINIDHHGTNPKFGTLNVVDAAVSSTSELVVRLFDEAKFPLNRQTAQLLYAGIMTDTGSFRYDITKPATHVIAARLLALGVNPSVMYTKLYPGMPASEMAHFMDIIEHSTLHFNNRLYCATLTHAQLKKFSTTFDWKERVLGFLRSLNGVDVVLILSELRDGRIRVNLRSQSSVDVARLCAVVGGGGHPKAAGATLDGPIEKARKIMVELIGKSL